MKVRTVTLILFSAFTISSCLDAAVMFDLSYTTTVPSAVQYEHQHTVAALSGLANRDAPSLFTPLLVPGSGVDGGSTADKFWLSKLSAPGEWLHNMTWKNVTSIEQLVSQFAHLIRGVVLYDPLVPATSSLAATAAGIESLLPVCWQPDQSSLYHRLVLAGPRLPIMLNLTLFRDKLPSPKIAAYQWARDRWLVPGKSNPTKFGYYVDYWAGLHGDALSAPPGLSQISNIDYFVANKGFMFDLSIWADEEPVDDQHQPLGADKAEMVALFETAYNLTQQQGYQGDKMIHVGGFTPWWFKYTKDGPGCPECKHGGVETEWETMGVIGAYNIFDDADACCVGTFANAAFYQHAPNPVLTQNPKPTVKDLQDRGLVDNNLKVKQVPFAAYYAGDYDGAAWVYSQLWQKWDDPKRGLVPIGWAIDPELSLRFPPIFSHMYSNKTRNDWFISGDSGAGYVNPTLLLPNPKTGTRGQSNVRKSGAPDWIAWNQRWYQQFDLSFTGFLINGNQGPLTLEALAMYHSFSSDGVVISADHDPTNASSSPGRAWVDPAGTPVLHHVVDLPGGNSTAAAHSVADLVQHDSGKARFYVLRCILQTASYMVDTATLATQLVPDLQFVDPYTLGLLAKLSNEEDINP